MIRLFLVKISNYIILCFNKKKQWLDHLNVFYRRFLFILILNSETIYVANMYNLQDY